MNLLPKSQQEFADPQYWKKFFEQRDTPFEWYGEYSQLAEIFDKHLKLNDNILQIGCGNSLLAEQLYDNGFRHVTSIDIDSKVIFKQKQRNDGVRPELKFECCSATETALPSSSVNTVIDKGTFDALFPSNFTSEMEETVEKMLEEVIRVLVDLGRYILVTLAQNHIVKKLVEYFLPKKQFLLRVYQTNDSDQETFSMPVFVFVITKLKMPLPMVPPMEFIRDVTSQTNGPKSDLHERVTTVEDLLRLIHAEQEFNWFKRKCSGKISDQPSINLYDKTGNQRYKLTIVDKMRTAELRSYAVFIVPIGRESDYLFSNIKGREKLRESCEKDRLLIVELSHDQNQKYESTIHIQNELNEVALNFKPPKSKGQIHFLSLGEVDTRKHHKFTGESAINGKYAIVELKEDNKWLRRLIFLSNPSIIQSECILLDIKGSQYKKIDPDSLACSHHRAMVAALKYYQGGYNGIMSNETRLGVLGLGGGLLAKFLYDKFQKSKVVGVEIDPEIVKVAHEHFMLPKENERLKVVTGDALKFLEEEAKTQDSEKLDVLFVDVAGPMHEDGLSCPPSSFVTPTALQNMRDSLKPNGLLLLNLVTRDEEIGARIKDSISAVFPEVIICSSEEDVNEVVICPLQGVQEPEMEASKLSELNIDANKKTSKKKGSKQKSTHESWLSLIIDEFKNFEKWTGSQNQEPEDGKSST